MMRLHVLAGCPFCVRVIYVLEILQLKYEIVTYTKVADLKTDAYLELNPKGEAPVLETKEGVIYESSAILRYLSSLRPELKLNGSTPFESSQVDMWMSNIGLISSSIGSAVSMISGKVTSSQDQLKQAVEKIHTNLQWIEDHLSVRTYMVGHRATLVDFCLLSFLNILYQFVFEEKERSKYPSVQRYWRNLTASSFHVNVMGHTRRLCTKLFPVPPVGEFEAGYQSGHLVTKKDEKPAAKDQKDAKTDDKK